jgi:phosphatidylglycerophosphate synthase
MSEIEGRRPIGARNAGWAQSIARALARSAITPNQISIASIGFAALAGLCFWQAGAAAPWPRAALLIAGALCCQARLLCNLFDGMVAVEGGKASKDGPFWNEFPDRAADILIFLGAGYGVSYSWPWGIELGWAAACFAVLTAYVRELGAARDAPADYSGPMAKQHRMAVITAAALIAIVEMRWGWRGETMGYALGLIALGAAFTAGRRCRNIVKALKSR